MSRERTTTGFGCPNEVDPHYVSVVIPRSRTEPVSVVEHFGLRATVDRDPDEVERVVLRREYWTGISDELRRVFNERLKVQGLATSRWIIGENRVERLLGKELCVLAWAIERASVETIPIAIANWSGLRPEERWWLFTMAAAASGYAGDHQLGWRKALRYALTENPVVAAASRNRKKTRPRKTGLNLNLFDNRS
ncbi:MAG TPA: anti-phage-associated DUF3780 domain-containing protein [Polyangiaceae bacterium]|jgi:hypothetical protein|nr:anti-phage-associated DUF3780 domain-containing protein [Polyangiaceae bacterium]